MNLLKNLKLIDNLNLYSHTYISFHPVVVALVLARLVVGTIFKHTKEMLRLCRPRLRLKSVLGDDEIKKKMTSKKKCGTNTLRRTMLIILHNK